MKRLKKYVLLSISISCITLLAGCGGQGLKNAQSNARDTAREANLSIMSSNLKMYYDDNGIYPGTKEYTIMKPEEIKQDLEKYIIGEMPLGYSYILGKRKGEKDGGALLFVKMDNPTNCNLTMSDIKKIIDNKIDMVSYTDKTGKKIKGVDKIIENNKGKKFNNGCVYVKTLIGY